MTRVLVVDDTPDMAKLMRFAVESHGHEVSVAEDGQRALQIAATDLPDVILLDVMMPRMSGLEVLRRLKDDVQLRSIPVILVTAKSGDKSVIEGLDLGAHDYLTKPFQREILAARVRSAIRVKQSHDRLVRAKEQLVAEAAERDRMQRELARAHKLESIGTLAAGIAHEINTPAQFIGDNTSFLQDSFAEYNGLLLELDRLLQAHKRGDLTDALFAEIEATVSAVEVDYLREEVPKAITQSMEGIKRIANIVRAMKEYSHPGTGQKQDVDLNRAIQTTLVVCRNEWKYVADLVTDFATDLPPVRCLPGDINQVILNLIVNAAQAIGDVAGDASAGKGTITVRTRRDGDCVEIRIEDTGPGIPQDIRESVFDPFFTTKEVGKGTGQGLAIAHSIVVEKHGGTIDFESASGVGTTFIVRLPITGAAEHNESDEPALVAVSG